MITWGTTHILVKKTKEIWGIISENMRKPAELVQNITYHPEQNLKTDSLSIWSQFTLSDIQKEQNFCEIYTLLDS